MAEINPRLELLNKHTKQIKLLKAIEKKSGLETGSSVVIIFSILLSSVLFGSCSQLICEVWSIAYPIYCSLYNKNEYWYTYWVLYTIVTLLFSVLPKINFFLAIRFLITTYLIAPTIMKSVDLHEHLRKTVNNKLNQS